MRRRVTRSRVSRPKRKTAWLNGMSDNTCSVSLTRNFCQEEGVVPMTVNQFLLVDNPQRAAALQGIVSDSRDATVVRIVGEIMLDAIVAGTPASSTYSILVVNMGIYIADQDSTGLTIVRDPTSDIENKDWLWKGTYTTAECALPNQQTLTCHQNDLAGEGTNANGSHIDIRVKRKLRQEESIILAVAMVVDEVLNPGGLVWACNINGSVRCLVMES